MLKTIRLIVPFIWISLSCSFQIENDEVTAVFSNNYPQTNLDNLEGMYIYHDTLTFIAKVEIILDSNNISSWMLNGERVERSSLLPKLEEYQLSYPRERRNKIMIDLGIDRETKLQEFISLRDTLRVGRYLLVSYLNSKNQRLSVRLPASNKARIYESIKYPPQLPRMGFFISLCQKVNDKFQTDVYNVHSEEFSNYIDCMKGSNLSECYTYVHINNDTFYWEGNEMRLTEIAEKLQRKYECCARPDIFLTIIKVDENSKYESYLDLLAICHKTYYMRRSKESIEIYGTDYKNLSIEDKKKIRYKYPLLLHEDFKNSHTRDEIIGCPKSIY